MFQAGLCLHLFHNAIHREPVKLILVGLRYYFYTTITHVFNASFYVIIVCNVLDVGAIAYTLDKAMYSEHNGFHLIASQGDSMRKRGEELQVLY